MIGRGTSPQRLAERRIVILINKEKGDGDNCRNYKGYVWKAYLALYGRVLIEKLN